MFNINDEKSVFETENDNPELETENKEENLNDKVEENKMTENSETEVPTSGETVPQWYVANTYSSRERIVADYLEQRKVSMNLQNEIFRIIVPEKKIPEIDKKTGLQKVDKNGEKKFKIKNLYPGYIFVEAIMTDEAWYVIRNTPGVTGIVGSSGSGTKPFPLPREDMLPILKAMNLITPEIRSDYTVGETVKILEGPFAEETGEITEVDVANSKAKVSIYFFGRYTTVDLKFSDLEKVDNQ